MKANVIYKRESVIEQLRCGHDYIKSKSEYFIYDENGILYSFPDNKKVNVYIHKEPWKICDCGDYIRGVTGTILDRRLKTTREEDW